MEVGDWLYLRRSIMCYDWPLLLDVKQARAFLEGLTAADGMASSLKLSLNGTFNRPDVVPFKSHVVIYNSSLPLIHDLMEIATLAECRPTLTWARSAGVYSTSFAHTSEVTRHAAQYSVSFYFDEREFYPGIPKPIRYDADTPTTVYNITTDNGNYLASRNLGYSSTGNQIPLADAMGYRPYFSGS